MKKIVVRMLLLVMSIGIIEGSLTVVKNSLF